MNTEDFCSYELSKKLKKKGFVWECNHHYYVLIDKSESKLERTFLYANWNDSRSITCQVSAPTLAQAQKWLRTVKHIEAYILPHRKNYKAYIEYTKMNCDGTADITDIAGVFPSYEYALTEAINKALDVI